MRLCYLDIETTGLDMDEDHITEVAYVIKDYKGTKPLATVSELVKLPEGAAIPDEIRELTGIGTYHCEVGGEAPAFVLKGLFGAMKALNVEGVVAHNGVKFDYPFIRKVCQRINLNVEKRNVLRLDTKLDVDWREMGARHVDLFSLGAWSGFLNPFPHHALSDVLSMMRLVEQHDVLDVMIENAKSPSIYVQANVSYDDREKAKAAGFGWQKTDDYREFPKKWVKRVRENQMDKTKWDFDVTVLDTVHRHG